MAHVLQNTQNFDISRCFAEDGYEMYKDLWRTCTAIAQLIKLFVRLRLRCPCRRGLLKLPNRLRGRRLTTWRLSTFNERRVTCQLVTQRQRGHWEALILMYWVYISFCRPLERCFDLLECTIFVVKIFSRPWKNLGTFFSLWLILFYRHNFENNSICGASSINASIILHFCQNNNAFFRRKELFF